MYKSNEEVVDILQKTKAVISDSHFVYSSNKHAPMYINKDFVYPHTSYISRIGEIIAEKYKDKDIDVVVGPALGGIILSQWTGYHLSKMKGKEILSVYTEKTIDRNQIFTRYYNQFVKDKNVLIVEDIVTTGGSIKKVAKSVEEAGGKVAAACAIVNKDPLHINPEFIGAPFDYLTVLGMDVYNPDECPLCKEKVPINTQLGYGTQFLEQHRDYPR